MERHIQRLENDIENFPKTDDQQDKFVEKMSISFFCCVCFHTVLGLMLEIAPRTQIYSGFFRTLYVPFVDRSVCCLCSAWQW